MSTNSQHQRGHKGKAAVAEMVGVALNRHHFLPVIAC